MIAPTGVDSTIRGPEIVEIRFGMMKQLVITVVSILTSASLGHPLRRIDMLNGQIVVFFVLVAIAITIFVFELKCAIQRLPTVVVELRPEEVVA